jgi:hypothetical protein
LNGAEGLDSEVWVENAILMETEDHYEVVRDQNSDLVSAAIQWNDNYKDLKIGENDNYIISFDWKIVKIENSNQIYGLGVKVEDYRSSWGSLTKEEIDFKETNY